MMCVTGHSTQFNATRKKHLSNSGVGVGVQYPGLNYGATTHHEAQAHSASK